MPRQKSSQKKKNVLAADVGNATTLLGWLPPNSQPELLPDPDGLLATPSIIGFRHGKPDEPVFGRAAKSHRVVEPDYCCEFAKSTRDEKEAIGLLDCNDTAWTTLDLEALLLGWRVKGAENITGQKFEFILMTVPAVFTDPQRRATLELARKAGVEPIGLIQEPTAALLPSINGRTGRFAVVDLGGNTLDISLMEAEGDNTYTLLSTSGIDHLGGKTFTDALMEYALERLRHHGIAYDPDTDLKALVRLQDEIERVKVDLSSMETTVLTVADPRGVFEEEITRAQLEEVTASLLARIVKTTHDAFAGAGASFDEIDGLFLAGGACRMPCVQKALAELVGPDKLLLTRPDTAVIEGAVMATRHKVQEKIASGNPRLKDELPEYLLVPDITLNPSLSHDMGVEAKNTRTGRFELAKIVEARIPLPAQKARSFDVDDLSGETNTITIKVLEGQAGCAAEEAHLLAEFPLDGLPPGPTKNRVEIAVAIDTDGITDVTAKDAFSHREIRAKTGAAASVAQGALK